MLCNRVQSSCAQVAADLATLRQAVDSAREARDEGEVRAVTLELVQAKIAKTALRLYNAEVVYIV
jgi:alkylation response protein AidB-like acyl-CoA dehydrogenase